jgi:23S rRNA G2445 N2-methylase RlmL
VHVERSEFDANQQKNTDGENKASTEQLEQLMNRAKNWDWDRALEIWRELHPNDEIRFRVTCKRSGVSSKGEYGSSVDIAKYIGGALIAKYNWPVDLHKHTLEVYIHVREDEMIVGIALTDELLSWRYNDAGKGLLKSSIAYCMCRLADLKPGAIMMDPMCGNGVVLLEAATSWSDPTIKFIASDLDENQIQQASNNVNTLELTDRITVMQMDASHMTLKNSSVDSIVSDVPFGKRHKMHPELYVEMLAEMWRVTKHDGNIVLLTSKKNLMLKSVQILNRKLKTKYKYFVNIGGLDAFIFHLQCIKSQ